MKRLSKESKYQSDTSWHSNALEAFRQRLAHREALPQLSILGLISGLLAALVAILFRLSIEWPLELFLPGEGSEAFESLQPTARLLLPFAGALGIGLLYYLTKKSEADVGVSYVVRRYQQHQAHLGVKSGLVQFFGGLFALICGFSTGREGPAVHLGATCASQLGQQLKLPNNSLRILVGCGVASAIAASFNTPLAGVIFAMEVVLMEYTITGFIPIMLAAVSGAVMSQIAFGNEPAFSIPAMQLASLWELPYLVLIGLIIGIAATLMLQLHRILLRWRSQPLWLRLAIAALVAGGVGWYLPETMGIGYDTLEAAMQGQMVLSLLLAIALGKLLVSTLAVALGIPGGSIGPCLVIGACLGSALGIIGIYLSPQETASAGFYAILAMGGMMGAALNAPMAALIAILELTYNPNILLPSMLVVVVSCLTARLLGRQPGLFLIGQDPERYASPVFQMLSRAGVTSLMNSKFATHSRILPWHKAKSLLESRPDWIVIEDVGEAKNILRPADIAHYLETSDTADWEQDHPIDLLEIPAQRFLLAAIHARATLQEALVLMKKENIQAVYVSQPSPPLISDVAGIITRQDIDNYYQL